MMKFCTMSAVEIVKGCKNKRKGTECLVNAFTKVLKRSRARSIRIDLSIYIFIK